MSTPAVDRVLGALQSATDFAPRQNGAAKWMTRCPAHDDRDPSLSVALVDNGSGGKVLLHCFAGCENEAVLDAAGLDWSALYDRERPKRTNGASTWRPKSPPPVYAMTDIGNAERLAALAGRDLRFVPGIGWHSWDGRRWTPDLDGAAMRRAKDAARSTYSEAEREDDDERRKALVQHALRSEAEPRLRAMVSLAQSDPGLVAHPQQLDAHPFLLNVRNGTLDLESGKRRPHRREDLLTKVADVEYDAGAADPMWGYLLKSITDGAQDLERFLARAVGYSLTGDTGAEALFFAHGPEATGKSTFLEAIKGCLGDYAATSDFETFLRQRDSGARADIARLAGKRLVTSQEVEDGRKLAEGLVKQLTGGDTIAARFLYRDTFEFRPQLKLWLAANARPRVDADDGAMWRRIIQVPFTVQVPEHKRDPDLKRHLTTDPRARSTILNWALAGCLEWQQRGLDVPEQVRTYTAEYRAENDPLANWLGDCCALDPEATAVAAELRASYQDWCEQAGDRPVAGKAFGNALRKRGCEPTRSGKTRGWTGIQLRQVTQ